MVSSWISLKARKAISSGIAGRGLLATKRIDAGEIVAVKGEFGIHEFGRRSFSSGAPSEAPTTWLPSVHEGAVKCGLGVRRRVSPPDASPPHCAQLMGLASRGCRAIVLGATAERRNLFFRSDLGLPWIRTSSVRLSR